MRKQLNGIEGTSIADGAWRVTLSALGMAVGLLFWIQAAGSLTRWLVALGGIAIGGIIYLAGVTILKVREIRIVVEAVVRRFLRN